MKRTPVIAALLAVGLLTLTVPATAQDNDDGTSGDGEVGASVTDVDDHLNIFDSANDGTSILHHQSDTGNNWWYRNTGGNMVWEERSGVNIARMVLNSGGNLGVGTTTPSQRVTVNGTIGFENGTTPLLMNSEGCCTFGNRMVWAHNPLDDEWGLYYNDNADEMYIQRTGADANRFVTFDFFGGSVGIGDGSVDPQVALHVQDEDAQVRVEDTSSTTERRNMFFLTNNGPPRFVFRNATSAEGWDFSMSNQNDFQMTRIGTGGPELKIQPDGRVLMGPSGSNVFDLSPSGDLTIDGTLTQGSDRNRKHSIEPADVDSVLDALADLSLSVWSYSGQTARHLGPMAQDFAEAFGLGGSSEGIAAVDADGVALAAIQALIQRNQELEDRVNDLETRLGDLESRMAELEAGS